MNKNGEGQVAMIVIAAVAVIVALVLFQASAQQVGQSNPTSTTDIYNKTYTAPATNSILELSGQELIGTPIVTNATSGALVPTTNYTIAECVRSSDGLKGICYTSKTGAYSSKSINVSYSYYPDGYADDAGARGVIGIIILLAAIGIGISLLPLLKLDEY